MAILQSTGIRGFLVSVKKTGNKVVNSIGKTIDEYTENFLSGFAGHGWKLWEYISGKYKLEIDALMVRGTFTVFELLVQKIRSIKGALGITQGNGKIKTVTLSQDGTEYLITLEDEMSFVANDFIRCQTFTGASQKLYHVPIQSLSDSNTVIHLSISDFNADTNGTVLNPPEPGDEIVQFGNSTDTTRQSAIYLHADEGGQPAIDVMFGINSTDWSNTVKIRIGGEIPGSGGLRGFYCVNGMVKGVDESGHTTYCIYPDGSAMFGNGSAQFNADKSGYLAGGAISWQWDEAKQKFVTSMGDVILDWNNLSDEAKTNLKGPKGDDGDPGDPGIPGTDANLLPWVQDYDNNKTLIDGEYVVSPKMFSGIKDAVTNKLTGVALGRGVVSVNGVKKTGVFGVKNGEITFSLDSETGDVKLAGHVDAKSGSIGDLEIIDGDIVGKDSLGVIRLLVSKSELSSFADLNEESRITVIERQESQPALFNLSLSWTRPDDEYDIEAGYDYSNASAQLISDSPVFATTGGCNLILDLSTSLHVGEYTISDNGQLSRYIRRFEIIDSISQAVVYSGDYTGGIENASVASSGSYFCRIYYTVALSYIVADQSSEDASGYIYGDFTIDAIYG
ncbi:MAG: hypothetical protein ACK5KV_10940, partial [Bacteroides graminisolvens]